MMKVQDLILLFTAFGFGFILFVFLILIRVLEELNDITSSIKEIREDWKDDQLRREELLRKIFEISK